jgi:hypothetical protein
MTMIKIFNPKVKDELMAMGFKYIKEQVNRQDVYSFFATAEIIKILKEKYSQDEYHVDEVIYF